MGHLLSPREMEAKAKELGLSMEVLCERAGIAPSTFYRWKAGTTSPSVAIYQRLCEAMEPPRSSPGSRRKAA
jgi:transcriptional regulator with XRE-family HTH domain